MAGVAAARVKSGIRYFVRIIGSPDSGSSGRRGLLVGDVAARIHAGETIRARVGHDRRQLVPRTDEEVALGVAAGAVSGNHVVLGLRVKAKVIVSHLIVFGARTVALEPDAGVGAQRAVPARLATSHRARRA